jgi:hypothetical protein
MKDKIMAVLTYHDQQSLLARVTDEKLRNSFPSRAEIVAYLRDVFSKAEAYDALATQREA